MATRAPNFMVIGGQLSLVGVNWFTGETEEEIPQLVSGGSFVPFYASQMNAFMGSESITAVPEPTSGLIVAVVTGTVGLIRRRRRRVA